MRTLHLLGAILLLPITAWPQTKWIAWKSHSGPRTDFTIDAPDGFGNPPLYLHITRLGVNCVQVEKDARGDFYKHIQTDIIVCNGSSLVRWLEKIITQQSSIQYELKGFAVLTQIDSSWYTYRSETEYLPLVYPVQASQILAASTVPVLFVNTDHKVSLYPGRSDYLPEPKPPIHNQPKRNDFFPFIRLLGTGGPGTPWLFALAGTLMLCCFRVFLKQPSYRIQSINAIL